MFLKVWVKRVMILLEWQHDYTSDLAHHSLFNLLEKANNSYNMTE